MSAALELLRNKNHIEKTYLADKWAPILGGTIGFLSAIAIRFGARRPLLSGIQLHVALTTVFSGACVFVDRKRDDWHAERDAMMCHYIELHPEDFSDPERRKYGQLFLPWIPVR
ncbi:NADH dehydrogenase [ubiquinone] 1 subunit C2 [Bacillus rossius redtenbacheri]|uniref:NADH dehydrogenase [ubiquinone] 1 subunit C2 n=1 Tax=Bacillus rossius redtenbacheri TaxID=93214 RepID=UPI002FDCEC2F